MFQSRLAPAPGAAVRRDLSSFEIWEMSLARSRRRRELAERHRKAAPKTKGAAAAMSAALLVSPVLPMASAGAAPAGDAPSAPPHPGDVDGVIVQRGDVSATVAEVQRRVGVVDDAIFGPITERAVGEFQARAGLARTGRVDVKTWKALFAASVSFVSADSAQAKRITAKLPVRPAAPKQRATGGGSASGSGSTSGAVGAAPVPSAPASPSAGDCGTIVTPVNGVQTSGYGDGRGHDGVDIAAPTGTPVRAADCGTVDFAGTQSGYGNIICIQHSGSLSTCYAHLSVIGVKQGQYVEVGQVVGKVGSTGRSSGPHLHFETRVNGQAQDPAPYLSGAKRANGEAKARATNASASASASQSLESTGASGGVAAPEVVAASAPAAVPAAAHARDVAKQAVAPPRPAAQAAPAPAPAAPAAQAAPAAPAAQAAPAAPAAQAAPAAPAAQAAPAAPAAQAAAPAPAAPAPHAAPAPEAAPAPVAPASPPTPAPAPPDVTAPAAPQAPAPAATPAVVVDEQQR